MPLSARARTRRSTLFAGLALAALPGAGPASAQQPAPQEQPAGRMARKLAQPNVPAGVRQLADIAYGTDSRQRLDAYLPAQADKAPIVVMVHGGAWTVGNKAMANVVDNKLRHWVQQKNFILVSVGYRLSPQADPLQQAGDVAAALAKTQALAPSWGGDPAKVILMGHSAGAHLVALLGASPALARASGAADWRGTVALDSAALDLERIMQGRHLRFYDRVFGADPAYWRRASPAAQLAADATPLLLVCSIPRADGSCPQSRDFAARARAQGLRAELLEQDLDHEQINARLGLPGAYTAAVDGFVDALLARP